MNRMPVALFGSRSKAEPLQKHLQELGFRPEIHDELRLEKLWFISKAPIARLEVPASQFERAYKALMEVDPSSGLLREAIRCPECHSLHVEYPQCTHKSVLPNLVIGLFAALGHVNHEFYCQECHFTWPLEGTQPSRSRPHMAPYYFIEGVEQTRLEKSSEELHPPPIGAA